MHCPFRSLALALATTAYAVAAPPLPIVEIEEDVYSFAPANNGAGPMWCHGSTCLVRTGDAVFASGLETIPDARPLNNCRWTVYRRGANGWDKIRTDSGRTREPSPLAAFSDGRVFVSANPTLTGPEDYSGPARPEIIEFARGSESARTLQPVWPRQPEFSEHSYRSLAADGPGRELVLFQNIGYTHAVWTFLDRTGRWSAQGKLDWPWGADYAKPGPIRVCYPNVALEQRAVYFCGVSDILEPNPEWRAYKKEITGREWDYDFRRLFYTWTPDITRSPFRPWIEVASREKTGGWITPGDLWIAPDGRVHLLWTERALDERLRQKFFPEEKQSHALNYAVIHQDKIALRRTLVLAAEGQSREIPGRGRFQVTPEKRLRVVYYVSGSDSHGRPISENRLVALGADGSPGPTVIVPLKKPFTDFFTATVRGGSLPSPVLELLGVRQGSPDTISYARIRIE